ncbi:acyl-CoA thioesterase [Metabacillus iocasae]|uniref:Acyl-CoA thioester hydrolase n=1 Tax=Priestia iocasae TaxID=2291674 RepID=A0ABS2QQP4_9BACI|nr:thioesterase family protein [Metabacillus iocasae]MBM7701292.1 acyl-CoA thioester hydrolase [Metabacillus iocasae]
MKQASYIQDFAQWKEGFSFNHKIKVRFSETDMFGHLNNTIPFVYFEEARIEYFKHLGFMQTWTHPTSDSIPVVADLQCDFWKQVFFGDSFQLYVKAENIGTSSVDLHYMAINQDGEVCFVGRGTMVQILKKTGKGHPWSDAQKELLTNKTEVCK